MRPRLFACAACSGLALANVARVGVFAAVLLLALVVAGAPRAGAAALCIALVGWWCGSLRLDRLDRSALASRIGEAARMHVTVTGPARRGRFELRVPGVVRHEPVLLELGNERAPPPQGAVLSALVVVKAPRGPSHGFDERTWLRRHGVHVVLHVDEWHVIGRRGGLGGVADALRRRLRASIAHGLRGERA
jgi:hypothetical protein